MKIKHLLLLLCAVFVSFCSKAYAVDLPPDVSGSSQASVIQQQVTEERESSLEEITDFPGVEYEDEQAEDEADQVEFFVKDINLEGNTIISTEELQPVVVEYEGKKQTIGQLNELARTIERTYRDKGYITTYVYVPPQTVVDDTVNIKVIEGVVSNILVDGNRYFSDSYILKYSEVVPGEVLYYDDIRRSIRAMNRNPDLDVRVLLSAGEEFKTTDVTFKVEDQFPLHFGFSANNYGTVATGEENFGFSLRHNNVTGNFDTLLAGVQFGENVGVAYGQYLLPIPNIDWKLLLGGSYAQATPKKHLEPFGVNSHSTDYFAKMFRTFYQTDNMMIDVDFGIDFKDSTTKVLSAPFRRDKLRVLRFGPEFIFLDNAETGLPWLRVDNEFSIGLDSLGAASFADPAAPRQGVGPDFFKYKAHTTLEKRLSWGHQFDSRSDFQLAADKLPAQEMLYLGGGESVRGYPEGDFLADMGLFLHNDYLIPANFLPQDWKTFLSEFPLRDQIMVGGFVDVGYGRIHGAGDLERESRLLIGVGPTIRLRFTNDLNADIGWGFALGDDPITESGRSHFHFKVNYET